MLALSFAAAAGTGPEFRADSPGYFAPLRSAFFDRDLDYTNEWERWGFPELPLTETGRRRSVHAVGPAVLWSPFYAAAHLYVRLGLGGADYPADGYSAPYRRAAAIGTVTAVALALLLLARMLARHDGVGCAALATGAIALASPLTYYTFVVPTMAHGVAFSAAVLVLAAWHRVRNAPSLRAWLGLGAALGGACLMRWQAAALALLVVPLAIASLRAKALPPSWLAAAAAAALAAFAPQMVVWWRLYGTPLTIPQGGGFFDWSSPRALDTLVSADHGLLTWTPALALGLAGLLLGVRASPLLHGGALAVFAATVWVNGAAWDWAAGDAFGARRYDIVWPLLALGLSGLLARARPWLAAHPLAAPAALLVALALWNAGFIASFRAGRYGQSAPLERVAGEQARGARTALQSAAGRLLGPPAAAFVYKMLSAEYLYTIFNPGGSIVPSRDDGYLLRGWGGRAFRDGRAHRWARHPEACVRLPLEDPVDLAVTVTAAAAPGTAEQRMSLVLNGHVVGAGRLEPGWTALDATLPARAMVPGENELCLRFTSAGAGPDEARAAAAISLIQLP